MVEKSGSKWFYRAICPFNSFSGTAICCVALTPSAWTAKGRLAIPTKFRDWLRDEVRRPAGLHHRHRPSLSAAVSLNEWEEIERKLKTLSSTNPAERLQRLLLGHAAECELDGNGRLLLSQPLRSHAGLDKKNHAGGPAQQVRAVG